jgi:protein O-GlcNAc transferase
MPTIDQAAALLQQGRIDAAAEIFGQIAVNAPTNALAFAGLGHCQIRLGREQEAWDNLSKACNLPGCVSQAFDDLAWLAMKRGDTDIARRSAEKSIALNPTNANALFTLARALFQQTNFIDGEKAFATAASLNPGFIDARLDMGNRAFEQKDFIGARQHYAAYALARPHDVEGWINYALALARTSELPEARAALERAVVIAPTHPRPAVLLALVLTELGVSDAELIPALKRAVALSPETGALRLQLASALFNEQDFARARIHLREVRKRYPENLTARWLDFQMPEDVVSANEEARTAFLARWRAEISYFESLDWHDPTISAQASETIASATSFYLSYLGKPLVEEQSRNAQVLRALATAAGWTQNEASSRTIGRKKRKVAIFASSLIAQSISLVWAPAMLALNPEEFEIGVFFPGKAEDARTQQWRARAAHFVCGPRPTHAWLDALRTFAPDIVVFSDIGTSRIAQAVASVRNAPVQVMMWAHPMTSGMPTIDYYLSADACEPENATAHYSEQLVRLPRLGALLEMPGPVNDDFGSKASHVDGIIRFLCMQSADKLHSGHDELFARILKSVPNAKLDIICSKPTIVAQTLAARMRTTFAKLGFDFDACCHVHPGQPLATYNRFLANADVCLDSLDFSGCITSLDALWRDLPIVTLRGELMRGRQTYGMLRLLGMDELIAQDVEDYVRIATRAAQDNAWRRSLSERIRSRKIELYSDQSTIEALADFLRNVEPRSTPTQMHVLNGSSH